VSLSVRAWMHAGACMDACGCMHAVAIYGCIYLSIGICIMMLFMGSLNFFLTHFIDRIWFVFFLLKGKRRVTMSLGYSLDKQTINWEHGLKS